VDAIAGFIRRPWMDVWIGVVTINRVAVAVAIQIHRVAIDAVAVAVDAITVGVIGSWVDQRIAPSAVVRVEAAVVIEVEQGCGLLAAPQSGV